MKEFILKSGKLEERLIEKTLMKKELQKMVQAMLDQANFSLIQSQSKLEQEQKDMATLLNHFTENIEDLQDLNFSQDNNIFLKKI